MSELLAFLGVAVVLTLTPGPATALVIATALRGGRGAATGAIAGNSLGVLTWALLSAFGVSGLVAASETAFVALKLIGAAVLVALGVRALLASRRRRAEPAAAAREAPAGAAGGFRAGLASSLANPKLAVFFAALFPQFIPAGAPALGLTAAMACAIVALDFLWFSALAWLVTRAQVTVRGRVARRLERLTGAVLIGLGVRLAGERA